METLLATLPVLGCLAMGVVMWLMMRGQHRPDQHPAPDQAMQEEISLLRAEVALLKQDRAAASGRERPSSAPAVHHPHPVWPHQN